VAIFVLPLKVTLCLPANSNSGTGPRFSLYTVVACSGFRASRAHAIRPSAVYFAVERAGVRFRLLQPQVMTAVERVDRRFRLHPGNVLLHVSSLWLAFSFSLPGGFLVLRQNGVCALCGAVLRQNGVYGPLFVSWWFSLFFPVFWTLSFVVVVVSCRRVPFPPFSPQLFSRDSDSANPFRTSRRRPWLLRRAHPHHHHHPLPCCTSWSLSVRQQRLLATLSLTYPLG
jgi:hypothetical protein